MGLVVVTPTTPPQWLGSGTIARVRVGDVGLPAVRTVLRAGLQAAGAPPHSDDALDAAAQRVFAAVGGRLADVHATVAVVALSGAPPASQGSDAWLASVAAAADAVQVRCRAGRPGGVSFCLFGRCL